MSDEQDHLFAQAEAERQLANMLRIGRVIEVDVDKRVARMAVGGLETDWLPWTVTRAGATIVASAPTVNEQRLLLSPYGDTTQGLIGPAIYQDDFDAPTEEAAEDVILFGDGTTILYNAEESALTVNVAEGGTVTINCATATIKAEESVTIDSPETTVTGNVTVEGDLTIDGDSVTHGGTNIGKDHKHGGVETGSAQSSGPS